MRKTFFSLLMILAFALPLHTFAESSSGIEDKANLLGDATQLLTNATSLSEKTKAGVYVVTTTTNRKKPEVFSRDYLAQKVGTGNNGIVLLIDMKQRKTYIWATGNLKYYITNERIENILDDVQSQLSNGNYEEAVQYFFKDVEKYFDEGLPNNQKYTVNQETGEVTIQKSITSVEVIVAIVIALVGSGIFVFTTIGRYQLKFGTWKYPFHEKSTTQITARDDRLVNSYVTTRRIKRDTGSSGGGSSGGSGGGRSF